ncbi:MAG: magnesium transporter [Thermoanaerobaculia bacterium]
MTDASMPAAQALRDRFLERYPDEAARHLEELDAEEAVEVLATQSDAVLAAVFTRLSPHGAKEVLTRLPRSRARHVLGAVDPSRAARLLSQLEPKAREDLLAQLPAALADELRELTSYPLDVAGSMMETRFLALPPQMGVDTALAALRVASPRPREQVFVVDPEGLLLGRVPLADLAVAPAERTLEAIMQPPRAVISALAPRGEVSELLEERWLTSLPVIDFQGRLLGVIRQDALLEATREEAASDLQAMVGASRQERALSSAVFAVRKRLPWLEINLVTAFLAAAVVGLFEETIAQVTALAVLLPVVAGQSGNTGAQALAVTMRGLALREVRPRQWAVVLWKEGRVGFANGLAVAATTAAAVFVWSRSPGLAAVIGISMVLSMTLAGLAGGAIPLVLVALRQDPAQSSSILLTTVTDVAGFFSFLGIASLMLSFL